MHLCKICQPACATHQILRYWQYNLVANRQTSHLSIDGPFLTYYGCDGVIDYARTRILYGDNRSIDLAAAGRDTEVFVRWQGFKLNISRFLLM